MADINNILSNLNNNYEQVTDLVPNIRFFVDDFDIAKNEYDEEFNDAPLGNKFIVLNSGKYLWVGIDGANNNSRNVRRYNSDFTLDETFNAPTFETGSDGFVRDVVELSNGKLLIVGHFTKKIMRLNTDGSEDQSFNVGTGFSNNVLVAKVLSDNSILVGGVFNQYNGTSVDRLVKLNSDGTLNTNFKDNVNISGQVHTIKLDASGKIYVGGEFANKIIRLNSDGTTDESFDVGSGFNNRVSSIELDSDGKVIVGGWFNQYKESSCNTGVVRLETNGDLDTNFELDGTGFGQTNNGGYVQCIAVQNDNKIIAGGWFNQYSGERQGHIIRFNTYGSKDASFVTGYGFGDRGDWEGQRVQSILLHNNKIICVGSLENYGGKALYGFAKLSATGSIDSERLFKYTSFGINDGYDDMYDGGNFINTNLTQVFLPPDPQTTPPTPSVSENNVNGFLSIPNTHSAALDENDFENENDPNYEPIMDGKVSVGDDYFGEGSSYFTNMYPGMYALVATNIDIEEFSIGGDLGSDSDTQNDSTMVVVHEGGTYTVFIKVNREGSGGENGDPSVNHIIIVPGDSNGLTQLVNNNGEFDDHCVQGLKRRRSIAYLVVARQTSDYISYEDAEAIAVKFLEVIGGLSSTQTYNYDFSPQVVSYYGEGGLDTAIVIEDGIRRSIQRTGYFELVNSEGGRKVVEVRDGETVTDDVEVPTYNLPTGNPLVAGNDLGYYSI